MHEKTILGHHRQSSPAPLCSLSQTSNQQQHGQRNINLSHKRHLHLQPCVQPDLRIKRRAGPNTHSICAGLTPFVYKPHAYPSPPVPAPHLHPTSERAALGGDISPLVAPTRTPSNLSAPHSWLVPGGAFTTPSHSSLVLVPSPQFLAAHETQRQKPCAFAGFYLLPISERKKSPQSEFALSSSYSTKKSRKTIVFFLQPKANRYS